MGTSIDLVHGARNARVTNMRAAITVPTARIVTASVTVVV